MKVSATDTADSSNPNPLPPLSEEEYSGLKADIKHNGVREPIIVDEDDNIIDGHHRAQICNELGIECPTRVEDGLTETEKFNLAVKSNTHRRNLDDGKKRNLIETVFEKYDERGEHMTDAAVGDLCGASQQWVTEIRHELVDDGQITSPCYLTEGKKRERIRTAIQENPDESNYAIGKELDVSKNTVKSVREELKSEDEEFEHGDDDTETISDESVSTEDESTEVQHDSFDIDPSSDSKDDDDETPFDLGTEKVDAERLSGGGPSTKNGARAEVLESVESMTDEFVADIYSQVTEVNDDEESLELLQSFAAFMAVEQVKDELICNQCGNHNVSLSLDCCGRSVERGYKNAYNVYRNEVVFPSGDDVEMESRELNV